MGAFICRMTTSNQDRQWVKLVNPLKPKRDEIDLFEQSWSLSWLYQQRWISLENKRLFFLGKPYWFSPSAVNGNGFGKFSSFLSLEWTSYPPLIFFPGPKLSVQEIHEDWELGCLQISIKSPFHQIIIVIQICWWVSLIDHVTVPTLPGAFRRSGAMHCVG